MSDLNSEPISTATATDGAGATASEVAAVAQVHAPAHLEAGFGVVGLLLSQRCIGSGIERGEVWLHESPRVRPSLRVMPGMG